ncbi:hypothetical protein V5O48_006080 [Marasmius crinis-equi]|uniref:F-box domain-containing protein n=1 Tax=Marasmius crinis-equi TaxID=585013 RepID=A0ABR3FL21_9AGAR
MEENIRVLSAERDRLGGFVDTYKRILNPVRRLPGDVMREIFLASLDPGKEVYPGANQHDSLSPKKMPWTLGQVSRRWREAALSCPSLWSFIGIEFPEIELTRAWSEGMGAQLGRQLRRSGTSMLSISLHSMHHWDAQAFSLLLTAICSHSSRWETLRVNLDLPQLHSLGTFIEGELPNLRRLRLSFERRLSSLQLATINVFDIAPKLYDITIPATNGLERLPIPWSQITQFRSLTPAIPEMANYSFLQTPPRLTSLFIRASVFDPTTTEVILPSLRVLTIDVLGLRNTSFVERLLGRINGPNLQELRVNASNVQSFQIVIPLRVGQTLRSFCLGGRNLGAVDWTLLFRSMPVLESLSLCEGWWRILHNLGIRNSSSGRLELLPRLRDIGLYTNSRSPILDEHSLFYLLESRFDQYDASTGTNELRLQKVRIHCPNVLLQGNILQRLEAMASRGLQIDISPKDWTDFFPGF